METLVIIPARGGSEGLPGKNIKMLGEKPLISYTVEAAREVFPDDAICVSTDSPDIAQIVEQSGLKVPFLRPAHLATAQATTRGVILHAIEHYEGRGTEPRTIVLLQPTSPFRKGKHIREAMQHFSDALDMVVSVRMASANPYFTLFEENNEGFLEKSKKHTASRRQDIPPVWEFNGAIYIFAGATLKGKDFSEFHKIKKYVMDDYSSIDIDTDLDWAVAEYIIRNKKF